jgi:hypothetical protein
MTTKKQKREMMRLKHEKEMEELRQSGLAAQRKDREIRAAKAQRAKDDAARAEKNAVTKSSTKAATAKLEMAMET